MKASDYIVEYLIRKKVKHVFGYPGGMVTHLMDSFSKYEGKIDTHLIYHEQAAAFAACGYSQTINDVGVVYATSGPGATNLITGICNAYFDSVPVLFITGQVNTFESAVDMRVRQRGFQETDIVKMVSGVTKYAHKIESVDELKNSLDNAFKIMLTGRKGPVLLDIPMDIQRKEVDFDFEESDCYSQNSQFELNTISSYLKNAKRPCIILGAGAKSVKKEKLLRFVEHMGMPVVSSMIAMDILPNNHKQYFGFIGAYGDRCANFIVAKSDLVLAIGSRLDVRQVGGKRECFAPNAQLIRIDIDEGELEYKVHSDEISVQADCGLFVEECMNNIHPVRNEKWLEVCTVISKELEGIDDKAYNRLVKKISSIIPDEVIVTTDVGQNQVWVAQSFDNKPNQKVLFSGGDGAMGYSLPAAIGAYYASGKPVVSFNGDGGLQMNLQELQVIKREKLPVTVVVFNNYALGMIRHFQEMYFNSNYCKTVRNNGYDAPNFKALADAYDLDYYKIKCDDNAEIRNAFCDLNRGAIVEIVIDEDTYVFPKLEYGKPNQDQEPLLDRQLFSKLMEM